MIIIIFGRAAQFLLSLAMMRVATTLLSPEEMGRVSLLATTIAFFAMLFVNPVGMFINRRLHAWHDSGVARHYLIQYSCYLLLVAFIAATALPLLYVTGLTNFGISIGWLIFLVCGSLFFNPIKNTAIPSLNLLGDSVGFVLLSFVSIAASFAFAALLVLMVQPSAQYWLLGTLIGQTLLGFIGVKVLFERLRKPEIIQVRRVVNRGHLQSLFSFAWPVAIAAVLGWVQGQGYRFLMVGHLGLAELGLFVVGYGVSAGILAGFESVLTTYFQPRMYRDASMGDSVKRAEAWQFYAAALTPSLLITVVFVVILAPELTRIFLGEKFQSASEYLVWGALAEASRVLVGIYSLNAHMHMRTRGLIVPSVVGATLAMALCFVLIPKFGADGVGAALTLSGFSVVLVMHIIFSLQNGRDFFFGKLWVNGIYIFGLWGVAIGSRNLFDPGWGQVIGVLSVAGVGYLGVQYLLLREHLKDSSH